MSVQEPPGSTSPIKPKPEIPPKPQTSSPPLGERDSELRRSGGKVKRIVNKFSKQESSEKAEPTVNGSAGIKPVKRVKRPPTIKPKPRVNPQLQKETGQAPPLPAKRRTLKKQKPLVGGEDGEGSSVEGGRSAPDGKEVEVELTGGGEVEVEHSPVSPCCAPSCSCICHLQRPGMKLIWVPVEDTGQEIVGGEDDDSDGEDQTVEDSEDSEESEVECGVEADGEDTVDTLASEEDEVPKQGKAKFQESLNALIEDGQRRRSDSGTHSVLAFLSHCESPPIPPKRSQSPQIHLGPAQNEEENIYEATLPTINPIPEKRAECKELDIPIIRVRKPATLPTTNLTPEKRAECKELDIPIIRMRKPACRTRQTSSPSVPTSQFMNDAEPISSPGDVPPPVPERRPIGTDTLTHWGGVLLPLPTSSSTASLSTQRSNTPPPQPHRPAPPPPKAQHRRHSSASVNFVTLNKGEENGENEEEKEDAGEENSLKKGKSLWESRLQDEPLYQTYRASVITKEIRRQTVCRNISKTSADYAMDHPGRRPRAATGTGSGGPRASPVPAPSQSTLWQELPNVRDSGVLETLSPEQCKYQESMFEVLTSETSYLRSLGVLIEHFMESRELEETMIIRDRKTLFSNIQKIREVSERFLKDLEDRIFKDLVFDDICDIIHYHAQHNFPAYIDYVRNQIYQEKIFSELMKNNTQFNGVITRLQESHQCQRLPFMSFLLLPFQRITRIRMLIENILKRTKEKTKEEQTASKALASVSKIIDVCNTEVGKMKQMEELIHISKTLEFDKLKAIPIISQTRYLEKKGELQEMSKGATLFNMRGKFTPVYFFLFNDLLVIAAKKGTERFVVLDHAHRSLVQVQSIEESGSSGGPYEHCFNLTLLENHQGRMMERLIKAPSQSDMHRWMAAFPNPTNPDGDDKEVIYEDWDCPQVQCVEQYVAEQADELNLEPTEIINVIRKTNEGLYEGTRLSDGQKGWFPVANVIEITNEHVRRRNLRERYRVMQAATLVANSKNRTLQ